MIKMVLCRKAILLVRTQSISGIAYRKEKSAFLLEAIPCDIIAAVHFLEIVKYTFAKVEMVLVFFYQ